MVTAKKSSPKPVAAPVVKVAAKRTTTAPPKQPRTAKTIASAEPSLRFHHSKALRDKTNTVLSALEARPDHSHHGEAVADLITELVEAGMDYYFLKALKQAQVGFVAEQSARLGMSGAVKLISSVSRKFITRMDQTQLLVVATHIRSLAVA